MQRQEYIKKQNNGFIKDPNKINVFDRILFPLTAILIIAVIIIQGVVFSHLNYNMINGVNAYDGKPLLERQQFYETGDIIVKISKTIDSQKTKIFINGEYYKSFTSDEIQLKIKKNDIVEADSTETSISTKITIIGISGIISKQLLGKTIELNCEKKTICS